MTDRELLELARGELSESEFEVWFAKHFRGLGRRAGSLAIGVSEEAWRYRLAVATRKLDAVLAERDPGRAA